MRKFYFAILILLANCGLSDELTKKVDIEPALMPYVEVFLDEAKIRGDTINLDASGLNLKFGTVSNYNGICYYVGNRVIIDKKEWENASEDFKSWLIFHELGHCILERQHQNERLENGEWKSLMKGAPYTGIVPSYLPVPFFGFRKTYYLDELFEPNTIAPAWTSLSFNYDDVPSEDKSILFEVNNQPAINQQFNATSQDYEIEVNLTLPPSPNVAQVIWGNALLTYSISLNPLQGFKIFAKQKSPSTLLYWNTNLTDYNGKAIEKITIRQHEGFTQIFFNDVFAYLIDELPNNLEFVNIIYSNSASVLSDNFNISSLKYYRIID